MYRLAGNVGVSLSHVSHVISHFLSLKALMIVDIIIIVVVCFERSQLVLLFVFQEAFSDSDRIR